MDQGPRYALFFVPPATSDLYRFGSAILGYDCYTGAAMDLPDEFQFAAGSWREITEEPRHYGFHATLKAPFRLLESCTEAQLVSAVESFAGLGHAIPTISPAIEMLSGFIAIVPIEAEPTLDALAASCTTLFDAFRAPISPQERARRIALGLSHSQIQNLDRWGYPYVLSEFRFHLTLTGKIPASRSAAILAALRERFHRMCGERPIAIDRLVLVKQDSSHTPFYIVSQVALSAEH